MFIYVLVCVVVYMVVHVYLSDVCVHEVSGGTTAFWLLLRRGLN